MTDSNLKDYNNFYADLAQSAYRGRPNTLSRYNNAVNWTLIDYSQDIDDDGKIISGGKKLPHDGKVYLQPDPDLHTVEDTIKLQVGDPGGGIHQEEYPIKRYQK